MDFLCIGQMVADILVKPVDTLDFAIDTHKVDLISLKGGGDSYNVATALAKLGGKVAFAGKCGNDSLGDFLCNTAATNNIDISTVIRTDEIATSSVVIPINSQGERVFFNYGGANDTLAVADIDLSRLDDGCKIVHIGGAFSLPKIDGEGAAKIFKIAQQKNVITSMDVTGDTTGRWLSLIEPCLKYLDFFSPSLYEATRITGEEEPEKIAGFLLDKGVKNVILKLGKEGCYVNDGSNSFFLPAFDVPVVDTTGAGDCFVAGFLTGLGKKWSLKQCALFASAVASGCIGQIGATTGVPTFVETLKLVELHS